MPTWKTPGVYVEELSSLPPSVAEVASAVPAFIGYTEKADTPAGELPGRPVRITSLLEFEALFGKAAPLSICNVELDAAGQFVRADIAAPYLLHPSLRLFYANGGGVAYVVCVGTFRADQQVRLDDLLAGVKALAACDAPTLLLCPDAALLAADELGNVQQAMLQQCAQRQDRFAVLDTRLDDAQGETFRAKVGSGSLRYGAAYAPWLQIHHDSPVPYPALRNAPMACPPSGAVAGVYATVDAQRGVWKAPANVALQGVLAPVVTLEERQVGALNVDTTAGKSINAIRPVTGKGLLVWGARTLAGNDNEWRYVPVRRFFIMVEASLKKSTKWVVFEPNDANTWSRVCAMIQNDLTEKWRDGALAGIKPDQAFYVRCGLNQTMTALDLQQGRLIVEVGLAMVRPEEFIILRFSHQMQTI
jgi:phage tail sheath protein FI